MKKKKQQPRLPRPRLGAEIIVKDSFELDCTRREPKAVPELLLLANKQGFRWLSDYFKWLADRDAHTSTEFDADPDDHQHVCDFAPINQEYSDRIAVRVGYLTGDNQVAVRNDTVFQSDHVSEVA